MTPNELIKILKEYDFKKNSVRSFALKYKITEKTILKYLKKNDIPYNSRKINYEIPRNSLGQYTFQNIKNDTEKCSTLFNQFKRDTNSNKTKECAQPSSTNITDVNFYTTKSNHQTVINKKSGVKNLTEFNKKYEKYFQK